MATVPYLLSKNKRCQADLERALKAATRAGHHVVTARINRDGAIELAFEAPAGVSYPGHNPWDN